MASLKRKNIDVLLGLFVIGGIALLGLLFFLIGAERRLFDSSSYVRAQFSNVAGLNVGAPVLLGGVTVGHVSKIEFPPQNNDPSRALTVIMRVSNNMMPWVREDSIARVDSKGLLGDKTINISVGSAEKAVVVNNGMLQSAEPVDINKALSDVQDILRDAGEGMAGVRKVIDSFMQAGGGEAVASVVKSFREIAVRIEKGPGIAHELIYDQKSAETYKSIVATLDGAVKSARTTIESINVIVDDIHNKKGLINSLIYDKKGAELIGKINNIFAEIESGQGLVHSLIYNKQNTNFIDNLNAATGDLASIMDGVKKGQGTIGKLLVDPSVYEDLKLLLGEVKRNELLKALVRQAITNKEKAQSKPK